MHVCVHAGETIDFEFSATLLRIQGGISCGCGSFEKSWLK